MFPETLWDLLADPAKFAFIKNSEQDVPSSILPPSSIKGFPFPFSNARSVFGIHFYRRSQSQTLWLRKELLFTMQAISVSPDCKGNQISCFKKENDHLQGQEGISSSPLIGNIRQLDGWIVGEGKFMLVQKHKVFMIPLLPKRSMG